LAADPPEHSTAEAFIASSDVSVGKIWPLPRPAL
jgi:hypothetical protein